MLSEIEREALEDIRDNIARAMRFVAGFDLDGFLGDAKTFYAATRCLEIISEASRRLTPAFKARFPGIPWKDVAGSGTSTGMTTRTFKSCESGKRSTKPCLRFARSWTRHCKSDRRAALMRPRGFCSLSLPPTRFPDWSSRADLRLRVIKAMTAKLITAPGGEKLAILPARGRNDPYRRTGGCAPDLHARRASPRVLRAGAPESVSDGLSK
jgi:hypothetical protein